MSALPSPAGDTVDDGQLIAITRAAEHVRGPASIEQMSKAPYMPWWQRRDVYYDDWVWDRDPLFYQRSIVEQTIDEVTGAVRSQRTDDPLPIEDVRGDPGRRAWRHATRSESSRRMIATLDGLGHATTEQLTALVGWYPDHPHRYTKEAWELGLLRRGRHQAFVRGRLPWMWTLYDSPRIRQYATALGSDAQQVFGGQPTASVGSRHTRHDVLVTEVVLRLLESSDRWVAVGPEHSADPRSLTGIKTAPENFRGDAVLWRDDGLKVVLEIAASRNPEHIRRRMTKWAGFLSMVPKTDSGLVVVILNASRNRHVGFASTLRTIHGQVIQTGELRDTTGTLVSAEQVQQARAQIHLASWEDWFPSAHTISVAGASMTTAVTPDGTRWISAQAADPSSLPYTPRTVAQTPPALLLTPKWVRRP